MKDVHKTTAGKVSVHVLPQLLRMLSNFVKGKYLQTEGTDPVFVFNNRDNSAMTLKPVKDINAGFTISFFLFLGGCLT
ncbi:MAG: hypothetical protein GY845_10480 [Planctomycetes bacterium]|nr:hypothetical protein [Planctomycetota bacterium]